MDPSTTIILSFVIGLVAYLAIKADERSKRNDNWLDGVTRTVNNHTKTIKLLSSEAFLSRLYDDANDPDGDAPHLNLEIEIESLELTLELAIQQEQYEVAKWLQEQITERKAKQNA